jgi:hypothetical protein
MTKQEIDKLVELEKLTQRLKKILNGINDAQHFLITPKNSVGYTTVEFNTKELSELSFDIKDMLIDSVSEQLERYERELQTLVVCRLVEKQDVYKPTQL